MVFVLCLDAYCTIFFSCCKQMIETVVYGVELYLVPMHAGQEHRTIEIHVRDLRASSSNSITLMGDYWQSNVYRRAICDAFWRPSEIS